MRTIDKGLEIGGFSMEVETHATPMQSSWDETESFTG